MERATLNILKNHEGTIHAYFVGSISLLALGKIGGFAAHLTVLYVGYYVLGALPQRPAFAAAETHFLEAPEARMLLVHNISFALGSKVTDVAIHRTGSCY